MSVSVTFLGGLGEIGRNCAAVEVDGKIMLIDVGLMFPEEEMLGVDLVFPDWSWLVDRSKDVVGVVLTHGHEDHMGALAYFLRDLNVPVYGSRSPSSWRGQDRRAGREADLRPTLVQEVGRARTVQVHAHPRDALGPDAGGIAFDTPEGIIVHSGTSSSTPCRSTGFRPTCPRLPHSDAGRPAPAVGLHQRRAPRIRAI